MPLVPLAQAPAFNRPIAAAWDARRDAFWLLIYRPDAPGPRTLGLWRCSRDGRFEPVCHGAAILPAGSPVSRSKLLIDPASGDLHLFTAASGHPSAGYHAAFDGERFVPLPRPPARPDAGAIAVDPRRGVVVFATRADGAIYERHDGVFRRVGAFPLHDPKATRKHIVAAWDEPRGALVLLHGTGPQGMHRESACTWDGKTIAPLPEAAIGGKPYTVAMCEHGISHPRTGQAAFLGWMLVFTLGPEGFTQQRAPAPDLNGASDVSAGPGTAEAWNMTSGAPWIPERFTWDGDAWTGHGDALRGWGDALDLSRRFKLDEQLSRSTPNGDAWEPLTEKRAGPGYRERRTVVWDPKNERVLISAGTNYETSRAARNTWAWRADTGFQELKTKEKPAPRLDGLGVWIPFRDEMLVVGGTGATSAQADLPVPVTEHFDGQRWTAFDSVFEGATAHPRLLAVGADPIARQVFAAAVHHADLTLWSYRGGGRWAPGITIPVEGIPGEAPWLNELELIYDPASRKLFAKGPLSDERGTYGLFQADLSAWLDSLPELDTDAAAAATAPTKKGKAKAKDAPKPTPTKPEVTERYLSLYDSSGTKLWFAKLNGASWTASWGRRGSPLYSKTYTFATEEEAWGAFTEKVQEHLYKGYEDAPEGEALAKAEERVGWYIQRKEDSPLTEQLGGLPPLAPADVPACARCEVPMTLLGVFHANPSRLPLGDHAALALFQCEAGGGKGCATWDPDSGANAALLLSKRQLTQPSSPSPKTPVLARSGVVYNRMRETGRARSYRDREGRTYNSKVGGYPAWVQHEQIPTCDTCNQPMQFAVQLDAEDVGANFGDSGVGYAFICLGHGAKLLWQCA